MKLIDLFRAIGVGTETDEYGYIDDKQTKWVKIGTQPHVSCHSIDKRMVMNHMDDELPMFIRFGPVAVFALRIPTKERYSLFIASSLNIGTYQINRYSYDKEKFQKIQDMLLQPKPFESFTSDEFMVHKTLTLMEK